MRRDGRPRLCLGATLRLSRFNPARPPAPGYPVLHLTVAPAAGQAGEVASTVLARVASCGGEVGAVILTLEVDPPPSSVPCEALYALGRGLRESCIRLHLVISDRDALESVEQYSPKGMESPLAAHPSLRSAVLASYAELPGPALVTAAIRAALVTPAEPLQPSAEPTGRPELTAKFSDRRPSPPATPEFA